MIQGRNGSPHDIKQCFGLFDLARQGTVLAELPGGNLPFSLQTVGTVEDVGEDGWCEEVLNVALRLSGEIRGYQDAGSLHDLRLPQPLHLAFIAIAVVTQGDHVDALAREERGERLHF